MDARPASPAGLPAQLAAVADQGRCLVMGVLNVTPDSFSDGGRFLEPAAAVARGLALRAAGADLVDVGGESTRPGAVRVPWQDELARVLPVVKELVSQGVFVSIDTMRARVAAAAVEAGAVVVNDVSGGLADPDMLGFVATARLPYVLMHWRGPSTTMESLAQYDDVVRDVRIELGRRLAEAVSAGVEPGYVVLDPGLGFAKEGSHNWSLLAHLDELASLGRPLLVGTSRKRFLGALLDGAAPDDRDAATAATSALAAAGGAWCVRVHEPASSRDAVLVAAAWRAAGGGS
jgi:dihydropteroate synthase